MTKKQAVVAVSSVVTLGVEVPFFSGQDQTKLQQAWLLSFPECFTLPLNLSETMTSREGSKVQWWICV